MDNKITTLTESITEFKSNLKKEKLAPDTISGYITNLKAFLDFYSE